MYVYTSKQEEVGGKIMAETSRRAAVHGQTNANAFGNEIAEKCGEVWDIGIQSSNQQQ